MRGSTAWRSTLPTERRGVGEVVWSRSASRSRRARRVGRGRRRRCPRPARARVPTPRSTAAGGARRPPLPRALRRRGRSGPRDPGRNGEVTPQPGDDRPSGSHRSRRPSTTRHHGGSGMSARDELDRRLAAWMTETASGPPPAGRFEQAMAATARRRPRPRWLAALRQRLGRDDRPARVGRAWPRLRRELVVAAMVALLVAALVGIQVARPARRRCPPRHADPWPLGGAGSPPDGGRPRSRDLFPGQSVRSWCDAPTTSGSSSRCRLDGPPAMGSCTSTWISPTRWRSAPGTSIRSTPTPVIGRAAR